MPNQNHTVIEWSTTVSTRRCIGGMFAVTNGMTFVVDAEPHDISPTAAKGRDVGVISVQNKRGRFALGLEVVEDITPFVDQGFEFAVAVQLVPEQVHQHNHLRSR